MVYDLCIVGAGMFGSAAARHASVNPALKVCLLGPGEPKKEHYKDREIFSSHYDEGRITRIVDDDAACPELCKRSIERYKELEKLSGVNFYNSVGCLIISEKHDSYLKQVQQASNKHVSTVDLSCRETFHKRFPFLKLKDSETALFDDNGAGHISPRKMVEAQKKVAQLQGCDIIECVVSNIEKNENKIYEIETEDSTPTVIRSKRLLITTGAFINTKLFSVLRPLEVKRYKRSVALLRISEEEAERLSSMPSLIYRGRYDNPPHMERSAYILPPIKYPDGNTYLKIGYYGSDMEVEKLDDIKQWFLSEGDKESIDLGVKLLLELIPGLKSEEVTSSTCVNCYTPSGLPYIDRITPTLTVAIAGNGKGAKFSDEVGRLAAKLCIDGLWDSRVSQSRFKAEFSDD